jgi:hypothetical protein
LRRLVLALFVTGAPTLSWTASAQEASAIRTAFVFNFIKLISWPESAFANKAGAYVICVPAQDPVLADLQSGLAKKQIEGRALDVRGIDQPNALPTCHVLYLGVQSRSLAASWMKQAALDPVLIVDEGERFSFPYGMIRLFSEGGRYRYELNVGALEAARLQADPNLIRLARIATP